MTAPVVVIGDALIDELRDDSGVREFVGGAALNVAVGLTRLGVPATLIAMVGDDEAGAHIRSYLEDYGVALIATPSTHGLGEVEGLGDVVEREAAVCDQRGIGDRVAFRLAEVDPAVLGRVVEDVDGLSPAAAGADRA